MVARDSKLHIETSLVLLGQEDEALARISKRRLKSWQRNQNLRDQKIYSFGGEIFSAITHGITAAVGIAAIILAIFFAVRSGLGLSAILSASIFGLCAITGFTVSTVYHSLPICTGKRVLRVLDHCSIYFIIAGTYTPFMIVGVGGWVGWSIFGAVWGMALLGCTLTAINRKKFERISFALYLLMGWAALLGVVPLIESIGTGTILWLLVCGGLAYTFGAGIYKIRGKYIHGIWHLFTLAGFVCHFLAVVFLLS